METKRTCLECGEPLRGRADQKFCNDSCRNAYNNKKGGKTTPYIRKINRVLISNHRILEDLNPDGKTTVYKNALEKQGFNFGFFTSIYTTKDGRTYFFVYEQGYLELENNKYLLVKKTEE